jgi:hypothetical protein
LPIAEKARKKQQGTPFRHVATLANVATTAKPGATFEEYPRLTLDEETLISAALND